MFLIFTLLIATLGGILGVRFRIPAGAIVGSMIFVSLYSIFSGNATMPQNTSFVTQIGTGAFIGSKIGRSDFFKIKTFSKPIIVMLATMMSSAIVMALTMHLWTGVDLVTSMFSCAPGGILDMSLIAEELGGNTSITALFQTMRLAIVVSTFPSLILFIVNYQKKKSASFEYENPVDSIPDKKSSKMHKPYYYILITMALAVAAGFVGRISHIPAGAMIFSMIAVAVLNSTSTFSYMPLNLRRSIQFLGGATIGSKITMSSLTYLVSSWQLLLILFIGLILMNGTSAILLHKICGWDLTTAMFASAPGGVTDMAMIASDMGADTVSVAFMQLIRLASVIGIYPVVIHFLFLSSL